MSKIVENRRALGKGLSALLPSRPSQKASEPVDVPAPPAPQLGVAELPIDLIEPNPTQPRSIFDPEKLNELSLSIKANGVIQPVVVQKHGDRYMLVAGERRWRASKLAGLSHIPAVVRDFAPDRILEVALIENIQREDLNPIEVAQALDRLHRDHNMSHEEIGTRTGKERATVSNLLRLLKLPQEIQAMVANEQITMGHARALLSIPNEAQQQQIASRIETQSLSVRQLEKLIQSLSSNKQAAGAADLVAGGGADTNRTDPNVAAATRELEAALGTRVRIVERGDSRGKIEIEYFSADELDRIYSLITGKE
jgi:ParB family chromosome partitioning protein